MAAEEDTGIGKRLINLHQKRFGDVIPLIRREHVSGYYARRPVWLIENLGLDRIRAEATAMEQDAERFYILPPQLGRLTPIPANCWGIWPPPRPGHEKIAADDLTIQTSGRPYSRRRTEDARDTSAIHSDMGAARSCAGLMDGSVSTLAPIFAVRRLPRKTPGQHSSLAWPHRSVQAFLWDFTEAASDDGELSGRGSPWSNAALRLAS